MAWAATGSGSNPAKAADFALGILPSGSVSFAAGQTHKTITVNVAGDTSIEPNEPNEGFTVTLSKPSSGTTIGASSATGTILEQMQFIAPNSSAGTDTLTASNPGQILTNTAGTDMSSMLSSLDKPSDLLPEAPHLRTPVDHSAGAPIMGINFGFHHSTGNFAMIEAAQHPTPGLL